MITNLPTQFPLTRLDQLNFGSADARHDHLLDHPVCVCVNAPIRQFLRGHHNILLGDRGAGKSAVFRLLTTGHLQMHSRKSRSQILVPINHDLQYQSIAHRIREVLHVPVDDEQFKLRVIWEIYILYHVLSTISNDDPNIYHPHVRQAANLLLNTFDTGRSRNHLLSFLHNHEKTIEFKLEQVAGQFVAPSVSGSLKPTASEARRPIVDDVMNLDLDGIKQQLQNLLANAGREVIILLDQFDEFVTGTEYDEQRNLLQSLLYVERSYRSFPNLHLKLFARTDIFDKLDFTSLGRDKTQDTCVTLEWTSEDIRYFIASRIAFNHMELLNLSKLTFEFDEETLYLDNKERDQLDDSSPQPSNLVTYFINRLFCFLAKRGDPSGVSSRQSRVTSSQDRINRELITSIFPRQVQHATPSGQPANMDVFEFLSSHLSLAGGTANPRVAVTFLETIAQLVRAYYYKNGDETVRLDDNNEHPLINVDHTFLALPILRDKLWKTFADLAKPWSGYVRTFVENKGARYSFSYSDIKALCDPDADDAEMARFIAMLEHLRALARTKKHANFRYRRYHLPTILRHPRTH